MKLLSVLVASLLVAAACLAAALAKAQTTTVEMRTGEVLAVDGNIVTARGVEGLKQFYVPDDFRFEMNGKKLSVHDLKPGMKVTAVVTVTETPVDVIGTEVRDVEVVKATGGAVVVRNLATKELKKFTTDDLKDQDIVIYRDGQRVDFHQLREGDKLSATIVTKYPPQTITEQDLKVFVAQPPPPPRPKPAAAVAAATPPPATLPKTGSALPLVGLVGLVAVGLGLGVSALRWFATRA